MSDRASTIGVATSGSQRRNLSGPTVLAFTTLAVTCGALGCAVARSDEPAFQPFRFVQLCDPQLGFGAKGYETDLASLQQAVRQINELEPAFVVICGDLVNTPDAKAFADFQRVTSELHVPCHCAPGNHDIGHPADPVLLAKYRQTIGEDHYRFKHQGCTFLVLNSQLWKSAPDNETTQHDEWLTGSLREAQTAGSPVFIIGHHPLFLSTADEEEQYFNIPPDRRGKILQLFRENGVLAVLTGHTHKLVRNTHEGIVFLSGETTSKNFDDRPLGFRLWSVLGPSQVEHRFVPLEGR